MGVAIEVPTKRAVLQCSEVDPYEDAADSMKYPGARISGLRRPSSVYPRELKSKSR
jgi:hypothetical protein